MQFLWRVVVVVFILAVNVVIGCCGCYSVLLSLAVLWLKV